MHLGEGPIITLASFAVRPNMSPKEIVLTGQKLEAVKLYLERRLDVF